MTIRKRQLASLFICSLIPYIVGNGLLPLLPVYAVERGADTTMAGLYLALAYLAIFLGALSAGWVSGTFHLRKIPLIISGLVSVPLAILMGQANSVWALAILTAFLWLGGGLGLALLSILTGMSAGENERGKIFGILALTNGLGAVVGGLGVGWLVKNWGYPTMFNILAAFMLISPICALLLEDKNNIAQPEENEHREAKPLGKSFFLLFSSSVLASIVGFFILLIRSLAMDELGFGPLEISSTVVVGGFISMPLLLLMGWLSDRIDRKRFLILGYLSAITAVVLLTASTSIWHFWIVLILQGLAVGCIYSIGSAWVTDLIPYESLGKGLALYGSAAWIGGIIGFMLAGYLLQNLGLAITCVIGSCLGLAAIGLLIPIQTKPRLTSKANIGSTTL